jgi:hypothetical protein
MLRASVTTAVGQNVASHSETRIPAAREAIPLFTLALETINVKRYWYAEQYEAAA